jgi:hypothetical protein
MNEDSDRRPAHDIRYRITDGEARDFLERLATEGDELRGRLQENPREVLLEWNIDVVGVPETVELPPADEIRRFIENHLDGRSGKTNNVGYAILYWMLGAMPVVVAEGDGAG